MINLSEKIKFMRQLKGWSQEKIAKELGMSVNGYSNIERGETDIKLSRLQQIADAFDVDLLELFAVGEKNVLCLMGEVNHSKFNWLSINSKDETSELQHELEKAHLLLKERDKEVSYLKQEIEHLKEMMTLLKNKSE